MLVLLRPSKEVLLLAGFLARAAATPRSPVVVAAALPLLLGGVWVFFALGRAYADCIDDDDRTGLAGRLLPPDRIRSSPTRCAHEGRRSCSSAGWRRSRRRSSAAAAGGAEVPTRRFLVADTAGALLSMTRRSLGARLRPRGGLRARPVRG